MSRNLEIPINRLIISFGLIFILGISFAILNGFYVDKNNQTLPFIVYFISLVSLIFGGVIIFLFQYKISKIQLKSILNLLPQVEKEIIKVLLENNNRLEQNHIVALTGYNKVKISRVLRGYEQKGLIEKRGIGNTNLIILKLK